MEVLWNLSNCLHLITGSIFLNTFSYCQSSSIISVQNSLYLLVQVIDNFSSLVVWHSYNLVNFTIDHSYYSVRKLFECNIVGNHNHSDAFFNI
jgi:hypothetical protein